MKRTIFFTILATISFMSFSQTKISLTVGNQSMTATLVENQATIQLKSMLEEGPVTINMSDYGGFEKVGTLPQSLPTSNTQITTEPGDIMLYQSNNIVIFYGSNSWSYTRLGKIDNASVNSLKQFLGTGNIRLTISLYNSSGIDEISNDINTPETVYDLNGKRITNRPLTPGIYIVNGKKIQLQ